MNLFKCLTGALALLIMSSGVASADDSNWGVGIKAGTLGAGLEVRWDGLPYIDFRVGGNTDAGLGNTVLGDDVKNWSGVPYDVDLDLQTYYLTANFHFPLSPFRFTAGVMSNGNEFGMTSNLTGDYTFGGQTWTQADVGILTGKVSFDDVAPYAGLGFDFELFGKAGLNLDIGVLLQGDPVVELSGTGPVWGNSVFNDAILAEQEDIQDDIKKYKAHPVISLGFVYNF